MAFTSGAARKFASPSCQQVRALSSRFSGSGCPEAEGTRLSGERVITRADSFHSASTSTSRRTRPLISRRIECLCLAEESVEGVSFQYLTALEVSMNAFFEHHQDSI